MTQTLLKAHIQALTSLRKIGGMVKSYCRRIVLEIINIAINHDVCLAAIGWANNHLGLINSVFLAYPATQDYGEYYAFRFRLKRNVWQPWLAGLLWQNGKFTAMFVISASDAQFMDKANKPKLLLLESRMEQIRKLLQAPYKTYAGILPGVMYFERVIRVAPEADFTALAVQQAIAKVQASEGLPDDTPIIVLGGRGFIGRRVVALLKGRTVHNVDLVGNKDSWPVGISGQRALVINITRYGAIDNYIDLMWPGMAVINEVYPAPPSGTIGRIKSAGCSFYNVVGVKAAALPLFPLMYKGGIPCCAAWPADNFEVIVHSS